LAIRYQALGDVVISLPYLNSLKERWPLATIDFLTREEDAAIPRSIHIFDKVIPIRGGRNSKRQLVYSLLALPYLWWRRYDVVLDLQNHRISRILRMALMPKAWCEFDKASPISAGERNRLSIEAVGLGPVKIHPEFKSKIKKKEIHSLLAAAGWDGQNNLVILNPAGFFPSRHWPIENYAKFVKEWIYVQPNTQFVFIGIARIQEKATHLKQQLGSLIIDLTGKTNIAEAFALVNEAKLILSEDGGLMHMAWVQGVPTLALFGSSRKDWSAPQGAWSHCLDSSDLACGPCMLEHCKFGDNRCLTRYSPEFVFQEAMKLVGKREREQ